MTRPKNRPENPRIVRPKRSNLVLWCERCGILREHQGFQDRNAGDGWPMHKCSKDYTVQPFTSASPASDYGL